MATLTWHTDTDVDLLGTVSIETALILDAPNRSAWETPSGPAAVLAMQKMESLEAGARLLLRFLAVPCRADVS